MLVFSRFVGQRSILSNVWVLDEETQQFRPVVIEVTPVAIQRDMVRIGFNADPRVSVDRAEVYERKG